MFLSSRLSRKKLRKILCFALSGLALFACIQTQNAVAATSTPPAVKRAEAVPNDTFWPKQWYMRQIHAPEAWAVSTGTREVIVAVIDGGIDINHEDLRENIWINPGEIPGDKIDNDQDGFVDDVRGWNFVTQSSDVRPVRSDDQSEEAWSHGTANASLIAAKGNNGIGIAGMAWNARIMPLVVLDADGSGSTDNVIEAIRYATNHGAKVINLSLVGNIYDESLAQMIRKASDAGVVIVAATGNDERSMEGIDLDFEPGYPVCMKAGKVAVIGVGGTDTLDQKSPYANFGRRCTDVSAPAQEIYSARPGFPHGNHPTSTIPGYLDGLTGTSVAAPLVSGAAALLRGMHPDWTPEQVRNRLVETADDIEDNLTDGQKGKMGSGRLNVGRALTIDLPVVSWKSTGDQVSVLRAPSSTKPVVLKKKTTTPSPRTARSGKKG